MQNTYNWYILYTRTGAEDRVIRGISEAYSKRRLNYHFEPFCPQTEFYYRSKQALLEGTNYRRKILFPNYVFLETDMPEQEFIDSFEQLIFDSSDIIRLLKYSEKRIALDKREKERLELLLGEGRCIRRSVGKILYSNLTVENGPLKGLERFVTHIDRHNRSATITFDVFGGKVKANVALEITEKIA